jgi:hypothetical protein
MKEVVGVDIAGEYDAHCSGDEMLRKAETNGATEGGGGGRERGEGGKEGSERKYVGKGKER